MTKTLYYVIIIQIFLLFVSGCQDTQSLQPLPPATPQGFKAQSVEPFEITLSWQSSATADYYILDRLKGTDLLCCDYAQIAKLEQATFKDTNLESGSWYLYRLRAVNEYGESESTFYNIQTKVQKPGQFTLEANNVTSTSVTLNWTKPVDKDGINYSWVNLFTIEQKMTDGSYKLLKEETVDLPRNTKYKGQYIVQGLLPNTTYKFRILAKNTTGASEPQEVSITTLAN